jgi:hypothetical protein
MPHRLDESHTLADGDCHCVLVIDGWCQRLLESGLGEPLCDNLRFCSFFLLHLLFQLLFLLGALALAEEAGALVL